MAEVGKEKVKEERKNQYNEAIAKLETEVKAIQSDLDGFIKRLLNVDTKMDEILDITDDVLYIIPILRKKKAVLKFEKAVNKYKAALLARKVNEALFDYIIKKRRDDLAAKPFELDLKTIFKIERKRGIFSTGSIADSKIFEVFRFILPQSTDLDEIEVITRKLKLKIESEKKRNLKREELVRYFIYEAGFDESQAVMELLLNKTLANALGQNLVTEQRLKKELGRIKGDFNLLSKKLIETINKKVANINEELDKEAPLWARIFSNYVVNPFAWTFSVIGISSLIIYLLGLLSITSFGANFGLVTNVISSTSLPDLCSMIPFNLAAIVSFSMMIIGGLVKMLDEKLRKALTK